MRIPALAFACVLLSAALVQGAKDDNPWPAFTTPAAGPARSIGGYSAGCLQGAQALPLDGVGFRVMRPSRQRYYGHPALLDFVRGLGRHMQTQRLGALLVGDLSQARGGRAANGHASHQTGLDVDIWYADAQGKRLSREQRETLQAEDVVDGKRQTIAPRWKKRVTRLLRLTVQDERVDRVFVNPVIKRDLCEQAGKDRAWLRKVRPWYGHADHLHVRLGCPAGDVFCEPQPALPEGDGCDKLGSWLKPRRKLAPVAPSIAASKAPATPPASLVEYRRSIEQGNGWPVQCNALLMPTSTCTEDATGEGCTERELRSASLSNPIGP
ncbi:MAG TPA: penicillin-insensitive murein endopeptidase [Polyangiales bacterium]